LFSPWLDNQPSAGKCPAAPAAVRKCLTKYLCRNLFLYLAGSFCYLMYWSAILFTYCLQKHFASQDCPPQLFVTMYCVAPCVFWNLHMQKVLYLILTYTGNFYFAKKRNIFSRPACLTPNPNPNYCSKFLKNNLTVKTYL
jgi:hypothetical protein